MIQTLNVILLTSTELYDLRSVPRHCAHLISPLLTPLLSNRACVRRLHLKDLSTPESRELFMILYRSWCNNAVATFSLCLLSQAYEHATHLIAKLYYALPPFTSFVSSKLYGVREDRDQALTLL